MNGSAQDRLRPRAGNVYDFDAWHAAMDGPEAHAEMLRRRADLVTDAQIDALLEELPRLPPVRIDADGYFRTALPLGPQIFDPAGFR